MRVRPEVSTVLGMARYRAVVPTSRSQESVYGYLADFRSVAEWDPSITAAVLISGTAGQVGSRYRLTMQQLGRSTELVYETLEAAPSSRVVYRCETATFVSLDTVTVSEDGTLEYDAVITLKGVGRLLDPLMALLLRRLGARAREGLAGELTSRAPAT